MNNTDSVVLEDVVTRLTTLIARGENIISTTNFFRVLLLSLDIKLKNLTLQNIKDTLLYIYSKKSQFKLGNQEMAEINAILAHINKKQNTQGYSNLLASFSKVD